MSNYGTPLHEPLTPKEKELRHKISKQMQALRHAVASVQCPLGFTQEQSESWLNSNFDKCFYAYAERYFPLDNSDPVPLVNYVCQTAKLVAESELAFQRQYNTQRLKQTQHPKGKVFLQYPEII